MSRALKNSKRKQTRGSGRLSKRDYQNMKGHKKTHSKALKPAEDWNAKLKEKWEEDDIMKSYNGFYDHSWNYRNVKITVNPYSCCRSSCGIEDYNKCKNPVTNMFTQTSYNMDWGKLSSEDLQQLNSIEYNIRKTEADDTRKRITDKSHEHYIPAENYSIGFLQADEWLSREDEKLKKHRDDSLYFIKKQMWINVYFSCGQHLMSNFSSIFYMGSRLNGHYVKKPDSDEWCHFKDKFYYMYKRDDTKIYDEINTLPVVFKFNKKNYKTILRQKSDLILRKRNFNFLYGQQSWRKTGFCMICEVTHHWDPEDSPCAGYFDACDCCGHAEKHHYTDSEYDVEFNKRQLSMMW